MRGFADEEVGEGLEEWRHGIHPEDVGRVLAALQAHFEGKTECFAEEYRVRRKDGSWMWVADRGLARRDGTGQLVRMAGSETEITQQKEFQAELERLVAERTARLQELVGELEHFSYTITHDMRAPLRAMRGFAEMASSACDEKGDRELKGFLGKISTSAERMDALIRDALNYSRAVRQELPLEDVDAGALLRGMLDTYPEFQPDRARIRFESRLPVVVANAAGLTQIFSNLLGNAVKFVKPGQIPEVRISAERRAGWVRIWVQDQGIGIPKPMLPRVFDMFSRGSRDYEGTGIGLALVRKVAQRMGGRVGVESKEGEGSRFWVDLQLGQSESGTGEAEPPSGP
jgi:PAS domain S-box-containing protein